MCDGARIGPRSLGCPDAIQRSSWRMSRFTRVTALTPLRPYVHEASSRPNPRKYRSTPGRRRRSGTHPEGMPSKVLSLDLSDCAEQVCALGLPQGAPPEARRTDPAVCDGRSRPALHTRVSPALEAQSAMLNDGRDRSPRCRTRAPLERGRPCPGKRRRRDDQGEKNGRCLHVDVYAAGSNEVTRNRSLSGTRASNSRDVLERSDLPPVSHPPRRSPGTFPERASRLGVVQLGHAGRPAGGRPSAFLSPDVRKTAVRHWELRLTRSFETLRGGLRLPTSLSLMTCSSSSERSPPDPSFK